MSGFKAPAPFREDEHRANVVPNRAYTREELLDYVQFIRTKAAATMSAMTPDQARRIVPRRRRPFAELLLHNLLHAQEHTAQLGLFIGQRS